tara:strand:+ start:62507 stop:64513 length:2007 start_codon:yes stop_codon:yes gene_type:complete
MTKHATIVTPLSEARAHDTSDLVVLRKRVALLEEVIESLGLGVAFCDAEGNAELNSAAAAALGQASAPIGHLSADDGTRVHLNDLPLFTALESREQASTEFFTDVKVHETRQRLVCTAWPLGGDEGAPSAQGAVAVLEDVTLRDRALAQLATSERTLGQALEHANEASRAKSDFLATMSHEIRTPMHSIIGTTEMLTETLLDGQQREYVDLVLKSADHLLALVNNVLNLSEVEGGTARIETHDFDFLSVVSNVVRLFTPMAQSKGIALGYHYHFSLPRRIRGDEGKVRQVLINLISNAIKFTDKGEVRIEIEGIEDETRRYLRLEVRDTGSGIDGSQHELIFDAFQKGEHTGESQHAGTGLGLAICRRYSGLLGGYIGVSSSSSSGSSFLFEAPYSPPETTSVVLEPKPLKKREADAEPLLRVLVVDDNPVNNKLIDLQLDALGHIVKHAADGQTALEHFATGGYDVVLMSSALPTTSGLELTRQLRDIERREERKSIPVLGFSANVDPEHQQACLAAGMNGFVGKRSSLATLYNALFQFRREDVSHKPAAVVLNRGTVSELRRLSPKQDFFAEMVKVFWANATQTIADLRCAAREDDTVAAGQLCHRLHGACEALGADEFAEACSALATLCQAKTLDVEVWLDALRELDNAFSAITSAVQSEMTRPK